MAQFTNNVVELDAEIKKTKHNMTYADRVIQMPSSDNKKSKFVSYAKSVNARFRNSSSNYIDLVTRLKNASDSVTTTILDGLATEICRRFSQYSSLADMIYNRAPNAATAILNDIIIDTTTQRELVIRHVLAILGGFLPYAMSPIKVYWCEEKQKYVAWDGQHTSIVLLILANAYGDNINEIKVPVNIYKFDKKSEVRDTFIIENYSGKLKLDDLDIHFQQLYKYFTDGERGPEETRCAEIHVVLESHGLFLTDKKLGDETKPGAITAMDMITSTHKTDNMGVNYSLNCLDMFGLYHKKTNPDKLVESREMSNIMDLFNAAENNGITVNEDYVDEVIRCYGNANIDHNKWGPKSKSHTLIAKEYESYIKQEIKDNRLPWGSKTRCDQRSQAPLFHVALLDHCGFNYELPAAYQGRKYKKKWFESTYSELVK
jgi:hypothetical protein|tara:strand:- start:822 stop:2114 length:1293 start_codon:yes stop_codon:yes gene_type:complete